jgi:acyl carrier protein
VLRIAAVPDGETLEGFVERLVLEYAQSVPPERPLPPGLSLRNDLAIESLSLVSLALRLGGELGVDIVEQGVELGNLRTVGDLLDVARTLKQQAAASRHAEPVTRERAP